METAPTLRVAPVAALDTATRRAIVALCEAAFSEDFAGMFSLLPDSTHVLAHVGDTLVSHALWVTRRLQPEGLSPLRTAYVEAVATHPAHERRGYATAVMRRVAGEIRGYELGALSPAAISLYTRLGWEMWQGPLAIRTATGLLDTPDEEVMILQTPRTPALDLHTRITAEWREGELW